MKYILLRKVIKRVVFANVISYKIRVILMAIHCFLQKKKKKFYYDIYVEELLVLKIM